MDNPLEPRPAEAPESSYPELKRINEKQRSLARLLAEGVPRSQIAATLGYSVARVGWLAAHPQIMELVETYRDFADERTKRRLNRMFEGSMAAVEEVVERLETAPEDFSVGELLKVGEFLGDRTGLAPRTEEVQTVNVNIEERLSAGRARVIDAG